MNTQNPAGLFLVHKGEPEKPEQSDILDEHSALRHFAEAYRDFKNDMEEVVILVKTKDGKFFWRMNVELERASWLMQVAQINWLANNFKPVFTDTNPDDTA